MIRTLSGDCREILPTLPAGSVHCVVTSPPYFGLRDYGVAGQIGLEPTPDAYVAELVAVFREVRRVLRDDGTVWLNLGDSYAAHGGFGAGGNLNRDGRSFLQQNIRSNNTYGLKPKDLIGIPWRVAFALQADGWFLRSDIIWAKPNPMPESVTDRPTSAHEHVFLLAKRERYFYDAEAVREPFTATPRTPGGYRPEKAVGPQSRNGHSQWERARTSEESQPNEGRNLRNVWTIASQPFVEAHFAVMPPALVEPCIKAGCPVGGTVLDPFGGAGTVGLVADRLSRNAVLIELNPDYDAMARARITADAPLFVQLEAAE